MTKNIVSKTTSRPVVQKELIHISYKKNSKNKWLRQTMAGSLTEGLARSSFVIIIRRLSREGAIVMTYMRADDGMVSHAAVQSRNPLKPPSVTECIKTVFQNQSRWQWLASICRYFIRVPLVTTGFTAPIRTKENKIFSHQMMQFGIWKLLLA